MSNVFTGKGVSSLFDQKWHKMALSVQSRLVSVHVDCNYISSKPLEPRRGVASEGNTFIGLDAVRGTPVPVSRPGPLRARTGNVERAGPGPFAAGAGGAACFLQHGEGGRC